MIELKPLLDYGSFGLVVLLLLGVGWAMKSGLKILEKVADRITAAFDDLTGEIKKLVDQGHARDAADDRRHAETRMLMVQEMGKLQGALSQQAMMTRHHLAALIQRGHAITLNALYQAGVVKHAPEPIPVRDEDGGHYS